jgi:putative resolvase
MSKKKNNPPKLLVGINEAADMLSVHTATLRRWDRSGKLKPLIISKRGDRRYRLEDIKKFINDKNE